MPIKLISGAGGSLTVTPASTASNYTLTVPAVTANVITSGDVGTITGSMIAAATVSQSNLSQGLTSMTPVASTSGTSIDFTGIPSWVRRVSVLFNAASISGTANYRIQLGSGSVTTSGYNTSATYNGGTNNGTTSTNGFDIYGVGAAHSISGIITFATLGSNVWVGSGVVGYSSQGYVFMTGGNVTLSGVLDRVRITTSNGTDTYDNGSVNVMYE